VSHVRTIEALTWHHKESTPAGCSKRPSSKAAGESKPEAYPQGYVEDFVEPRTKLAGFFSILLLSGSCFQLPLFNQAGEVRALEFEAIRRLCLIAFSVLDGLLDDVAAMGFHRFMVRE
jgi:hypothetical protein